MTTKTVNLWWRIGVVGAAVVIGCSPPESGEEGESGGTGTTSDVGFRGGISVGPVAEDVAAPFRLRVAEESRSGASLLVFSPANVQGEAMEGVLLVIGAELTAPAGLLGGVIAESVEDVDDVVEMSLVSRPGGLPRMPLAAPWTDVGRAVTRLARVTATVDALELTEFEAALWVVRGRVRVLPGPIVVTARDFFWVADASRILIDEGAEELPLKLKASEPRPGRPMPKIGAVPGGRLPGPTVGAGHGGPTGDPGPGTAGGFGFGPEVGPTGPSGQVGIWPVWPGPVVPVVGPTVGPGVVEGVVVEEPGAPAGPVVPGPEPMLLGEAPLPAPPAPEPQSSECTSSSDCGDGQRCILYNFNGSTARQCSEECADGFEALCVDAAGCCNIDQVCTEAGTCVQPGDTKVEDPGGQGCNDSSNEGCTGGCGDPSPGCGNGLNEGCNSAGEGCSNAGDGCSKAGDSFGDGCGDVANGCGDAASGCGDIGSGCGDALGGCGDISFCRIEGRRIATGGRERGGPGRAAMSWFSWLVVFFVVSPRRRRR